MGLFSRLFRREKRASAGAAGHPSALHDPVLVKWLGGGVNTSAGIAVTPESAMRVSAVYACVKLIANQVGQTQPLLYAGTDEDRERDRAHWLNKLLTKRPNKWQTPFQFKQMLTGHLLLRGKAFAEVVQTNAGTISDLIPLHPDRVRPFLAPNGSIAFEHYPERGPRRILLAGEVLYLADLTIGDGVNGVSAIELHRETIGLSMGGTTYATAFFGNNASPRGGIKLPAVLGDKAANALRESWERRHKGAENAHRLAILDGGMEWVQIGMTNEDAQFLDMMRFTVEDIARIFGVPPHMIAATDKQTSWGTGIEQQSLGFLRFSLMPWFTLWEQALMRDLMTEAMRETHFIEFNADALMRGDYKTRVEGMTAEVNAGTLLLNDARRIMNRKPVPGGDRPRMPANHWILGDDGLPIVPKAPATPAEPKQEPANGT